MNIHAYKESFIIDAILTILNISMDLAIGYWLKGEISGRNLPYYTEVDMVEFKIGLFFALLLHQRTQTQLLGNKIKLVLIWFPPQNTFIKDFYYMFFFPHIFRCCLQNFLLFFQHYLLVPPTIQAWWGCRNGKHTGGINNWGDGRQQDTLGQKCSLEDHGMCIFLEQVMVSWNLWNCRTVSSGERF